MSLTTITSLFRPIIISDSILEDIQEFVNEYDYSEYKKRGQFNIQKCAEDNFMAKCAEWGAYEAMKDFLPQMTKPDMRIYESYKKSWEPDLSAKKGKIQFLCKSCKVERKKFNNQPYDFSWIVQKKNLKSKGGTDQEFYFNPSENKIVLCSTVEFVRNEDKELDRVESQIVTTFPTTLLHGKYDLFQMPKRERLRESKHAIYHRDLGIIGYRKYIAPALQEYFQD